MYCSGGIFIALATVIIVWVIGKSWNKPPGNIPISHGIYLWTSGGLWAVGMLEMFTSPADASVSPQGIKITVMALVFLSIVVFFLERSRGCRFYKWKDLMGMFRKK